jgi:hypothetical protein
VAAQPGRAGLLPFVVSNSPVNTSFNGSPSYDAATGNFRSQSPGGERPGGFPRTEITVPHPACPGPRAASSGTLTARDIPA